jgi:death on curing protein
MPSASSRSRKRRVSERRRAAGEPTWVPRTLVESGHHLQLEEHGGLQGLRDENALEAALARPLHKFAYDPDADIADLAAAYAYAIATSHPFADGNKRTAFMTAVLFLGLNGYHPGRSSDEVVETMINLAAGKITETKLAAWFRETLRPLPPEPKASPTG